MKDLIAYLMILANILCYGHSYPSIPSSLLAAAADEFSIDDQENYIGLLEEKSLQQYLMDNKYSLSLDEVPDRIIGGTDAAVGEAPYLVQLMRRFLFSNQFLCGGSLITPKTVLTAGHCVSNFFTYRIRYGTNSRFWSPYPDAEVKEMKPHPQFDLRTVRNDIALFILKKPIQPGANVQMVELETNATAVKSNATLFGFGLTKGTSKTPASKLQKTTLIVMDNDRCAEHIAKLGTEKGPGMFCASAPRRSACNGDSGGPLIDSKNGKQIGVVSFGTRFCPPGSTNVYTNVSYYSEWINENKVE